MVPSVLAVAKVLVSAIAKKSLKRDNEASLVNIYGVFSSNKIRQRRREAASLPNLIIYT